MGWLSGGFHRHGFEKGAQLLLSAFTNKCVAALEQIGDEASWARKDDQALAVYAVALSLCPSSPNTLLNRWVSTMLRHGSTNKILDGAREVSLIDTLIMNADFPFISLSLQKLPFTMRYAMLLKEMAKLLKQSVVFERCRISSHKTISATSERSGSLVSGHGKIPSGIH